MKIPTGAKRAGPRPRWRPLTVVVGLLAGMTALAASAVDAPPAGAVPVDSTTPLTLTCTAQTPIGPVAADATLALTATYENEISRGQSGQITVTQPPQAVPTTQVSNGVTATLNNLNGISLRFRPPDNFLVTGVSTVGGSHPSSASYSAATNVITLSIPGPVNGGTSLQPPSVVIDVKAIGPVGSSGDLKVDSYQLTANATATVSGNTVTTNAVTVCPTPAANPAIAHLSVASGSFVPQRQPVTQSGQAFGSCTVRHQAGAGILLASGSAAYTASSVQSPQFFLSSMKDVAPGATVTAEVALAPYDFVGRWNAHVNTYLPGGALGGLFGSSNILAHEAVGVQDLAFQFQPPAGFNVVSVTSAAGMTATYNSATNRITWARAAGTAGRIPLGPFQSSFTVTLQATASVTAPVTYSPFTFRGMTETLISNRTGMSGSILSPTIQFNPQPHPVNCFAGGASASDNNRPTNPTTPQPSSNTLAPGALAGNLPYNQRIGWPTAITAWPAALNVATSAATPPAPNANVVIGTIGVADGPTAVGDDPGIVANNSTITIPVLANDTAGSNPLDPASVTIVDFPTNGNAVTNPDGTITYTPTIGTEEPGDSFTYVVLDTAGRVSNLATVDLGLLVRSLVQTIDVDVLGDVLTLEQAGGSVTLFEPTSSGVRDLLLDGTPKDAVGALNTLTVTDRRGNGGTWDVTASVSDFLADGYTTPCPANDSSSWDFRCVPGVNLGWSPAAAVSHLQVPGDVADVDSGSAVAPASIQSGTYPTVVGEGLAIPRALCGTRGLATQAGGTFTCGADLALTVPASAAAGHYTAVLTITLVG